MRVSIRIIRIVALLVLAIVVPLSVTSVGSHFVGDRVYLKNSTRCRVVVMEEHDGHGANPGETVLVKPGFLERTPTMLIVSGSAFLFGGLHFAMNTLQVRDKADIAIPSSWLSGSLAGRTLTYELTENGHLLVVGPPTLSSALQPQGLPIMARTGPTPIECLHG